MSQTLYAGVDGGGTKTTVVLVDENGGERARVQASTSNAAVIGHEGAGTVLRTAIQAAVESVAGPATIVSAWLGLSGGDRPEDHQRLRPWVADLATDVRMTNDAELILGALPGSAGLAIVSGTGSIAFGRNPAGDRIRAGGWGPVMGDEGSGYDLARRLLAAFTAEVDGRGPETALTRRLTTRLHLAEPHRLIAWVYGPETSKAAIADLATIVIEGAEDGDPVATGILRDSAEELAKTAAAAARRLGFAGRLPVALTGGLLVNAECFRSTFIECLAREWPRIDVHIVGDPALTAARSLALEQGALTR